MERPPGKRASTLSGAIRQAIRALHLSASQVAERAGLGRSDLEQFCAAEMPLPSDAIDRLGRVLKVRLERPRRWPIEKIRVRRRYGTLTAALSRRLERVRKLIAGELPDLIRRNQMAHDAAKQKTISGALRSAIHSCGILLPDLAGRAGVKQSRIAAFLSGEQALPSDAMDRLTLVLKLKLQPTTPKHKARTAKAG